ncbi:cyclic nucleotide-binding domain-containing protein [Pendulispora brunnea]|uniref:Cyclic nucleotide-binding domain-containing protein n=1 Tax=Pendulispora brunnea TaxID=2905690 RepID=A0ABZ2K1U4_9BACT
MSAPSPFDLNGNGHSGNGHNGGPQSLTSLGTAAARKLATTTKSVPQMQGITSRWLLRMLPWVQTSAGVYRVNRRLSYAVGDGRVTFVSTGAKVEVIPGELCELPLLRGIQDDGVLRRLASKFVQKEYKPGETIVKAGKAADHVYLIAHGKANKLKPGKYGDEQSLAVLADGDHFGDDALVESRDHWPFTVTAVTACTVLSLSQKVFEDAIKDSDTLRQHVEKFKLRLQAPQDKHGQAAIELAAGHVGEPILPETFVDYELTPREYELSVAQTVLRVHSRVADLYNDPMDQIEQQLRLTVEALRERQEDEMINNREFGLLHNADFAQRINTRSGPPTPEDMDDLLSRRRKTQFFLAHPRTIAAFGRECTKKGVYPQQIEFNGSHVWAWRGVPVLPCNKIPVTDTGTSSILAMRTGQEDQGVIGLHQTGIPDEYQPSLNVRFMGLDEKGVISYLVSNYFSVAVLIPDALGILENVELGH